jgi:DNA segregation ATPase FtsK/SpoIIIE-like protein
MINIQSFTESIALKWATWQAKTESTHKLLARDINAINALLSRHKGDAYVSPKGCVHSRHANLVRYEVVTGGKHSEVTGLRVEINAALTKARNEFVRVRFTEPILAIEAPHPAGPQALLWEDAPLEKLRSRHMLIGNSYGHGKRKTAVIDFSDDSIAHVLGASRSGGGKTMLLRNMVLSLADSTSPRMATFIILDGKNDKKLRPLGDLPHLPHGVTGGMDACIEMLDRIIAEKDLRTKEDYTFDLYVFIDELSSFITAGKDTKEKITNLANIGRGLGIHLIMYTQNPLAEVIGSDVKANVSVTLGGSVRSTNNEQVIFGPGVNSGAERLPGKGSFLVMRDGGDLDRIQTYFMDDQLAQLEVGRILDHWNGSIANQIVNAGEAGPVLPKGVSQDEVDNILGKYSRTDILEDIDDKNSKWLPNMKAAIARCRDKAGDAPTNADYAWAKKVVGWLVDNDI